MFSMFGDRNDADEELHTINDSNPREDPRGDINDEDEDVCIEYISMEY